MTRAMQCQRVFFSFFLSTASKIYVGSVKCLIYFGYNEQTLEDNEGRTDADRQIIMCENAAEELRSLQTASKFARL